MHLDSLSGHNNSSAIEISSPLSRYLTGGNIILDLPTSVGQQNNMSDCGIMVILFFEYCISQFSKAGRIDDQWSNYSFSGTICAAKRRHLADLMKSLKDAN